MAKTAMRNNSADPKTEARARSRRTTVNYLQGGPARLRPGFCGIVVEILLSIHFLYSSAVCSISQLCQQNIVSDALSHPVRLVGPSDVSQIAGFVICFLKSSYSILGRMAAEVSAHQPTGHLTKPLQTDIFD